MSSRWLTGNGARSLSRLIRQYEFSPAFTRNVVEHLGNDPDTYYIIGPDYRIPEPSEEEKTQCIRSIAAKGSPTTEHRERLVDAGRAAWRTPSAQTK